MLLAFPILAILCAPALLFVLGRPRFVKLPKGKNKARISIIIPARNEEANIEALLKSIKSQETSLHEIIVVDDGSTDNTASIAIKHGATVINGKSLPDNWKGKPWACQQGADTASGEWLLFLDADTRLQNNFIYQLQHLTQTNKVYSVCPYHVVKKPYEQLSTFFNVLMVAGSNAFGLGKASHGQAALFGQCMFISRKHYDQVGGHCTVKDQVLENFHLASHLEQLGIKRQCYLGKNAIHMRMFPEGYRDLCASWKKGFVSGAASAHPNALAFSSIWISGGMFVLVSLLIALTPYAGNNFLIWTGIAYALYAGQCLFSFRLVGSFSILSAILFPICLIFYQILFFNAIFNRKRGKQTMWKGRMVD